MNNSLAVASLPPPVSRMSILTPPTDIIEAEVIEIDQPIQKRCPFITANSEEISKETLAQDLVPVFSRSNDTAISTLEFVSTCEDAMRDFYRGETDDPAIIRGSHIIKGRTNDALNIPTALLREDQRTHYYERVIFAVEVPTIYEDINGNRCVLSLVGFKNYGADNLRGNLSTQHFDVAVSLTNTVCSNGCIFSENKISILATTPAEIYQSVMQLLSNYDLARHVNALRTLHNSWLTKEQFIYLLGAVRYYSYLSLAEKRNILPNPILLTETMMNECCRQYILDENFSGSEAGIDMWKFYNLLTGSNKNSYLHSYLDRATNISQFSFEIANALSGDTSSPYNWFINQ